MLECGSDSPMTETVTLLGASRACVKSAGERPAFLTKASDVPLPQLGHKNHKRDDFLENKTASAHHTCSKSLTLPRRSSEVSCLFRAPGALSAGSELGRTGPWGWFGADPRVPLFRMLCAGPTFSLGSWCRPRHPLWFCFRPRRQVRTAPCAQTWPLPGCAEGQLCFEPRTGLSAQSPMAEPAQDHKLGLGDAHFLSDSTLRVKVPRSNGMLRRDLSAFLSVCLDCPDAQLFSRPRTGSDFQRAIR